MRALDAGTPQRERRPTIELKCKGRKQSQQRRNLKSRGYLASNSRGERSPKNWTTVRMHWPRRDGIGLGAQERYQDQRLVGRSPFPPHLFPFSLPSRCAAI